MKANAPEKIYLSSDENGTYYYTEGIRFEREYVEYTRTDVFIEKACSRLNNHYREYMDNPAGKRLEAFFGIDMCNDFEKYMEGE